MYVGSQISIDCILSGLLVGNVNWFFFFSLCTVNICVTLKYKCLVQVVNCSCYISCVEGDLSLKRLDYVYGITVSLSSVLRTKIKIIGMLARNWFHVEHTLSFLDTGVYYNLGQHWALWKVGFIFFLWPHTTLSHCELAFASQINNLATGHCYDCVHGTPISKHMATVVSYSTKVELKAPIGQRKAHLNLHNHLSEVDGVWGAISSICHSHACKSAC